MHGLQACLFLNTLLLLHSAFMHSIVKMQLKGEVGGHALNSHGNYYVDHDKSWKNHRIVFLNVCWKPEFSILYNIKCLLDYLRWNMKDHLALT